MKTTEYWKDYWNKYRLRQANSMDDLYFQVGKTIDKKPISHESFMIMIEGVHKKLALGKEDTVIDLCCGNGLVTYELSSEVKEIFAVDFAKHLIDTARQLRSSPNIAYFQNDAIFVLREVLSKNNSKSIKILMHDSLAYFEPQDLNEILAAIQEFGKGKTVSLFMTGIPDDERKWSFYDTPERRQRYLENTDKTANDGMGRWWRKNEIAEICARYPVRFSIEDQLHVLSKYRMNLFIEHTVDE